VGDAHNWRYSAKPAAYFFLVVLQIVEVSELQSAYSMFGSIGDWVWIAVGTPFNVGSIVVTM
jgi:hypothetical protein